eukprot:766960_1
MWCPPHRRRIRIRPQHVPRMFKLNKYGIDRRMFTVLAIIIVLTALYTLVHLWSTTNDEHTRLDMFKQNMLHIASPFPSAQDFENYAVDKPPFDIDIVYCYAGQITTSNNPRQRDNFELKYSMRSIHQHMPWIHSIFIIVPDSLAIHLAKDALFPSWLDAHSLTANNIHFIAQSLIFRIHSNGIDNHNSNALEANMMRIPHLSEHFIYFNDDFFIGQPLPWSFFFSPTTPHLQRWPLNHYLKYHQLDMAHVDRENVYEYKVYELEGKPIPNRVNHYVTHAPRPLTKSMLTNYIDVRYKEYFAFMESHKTRWCSRPTLWNVIFGFKIKYCVQMLYLWITRQSYYSTNHCGHEETLFLSLFKSYLQGEVHVDIMHDPPDEDAVTNYYRYNVEMQEKCKEIERLRPYTFNLNDDFGHYGSAFYRQQVDQLHKCLENQFPNSAVWETKDDY